MCCFLMEIVDLNYFSRLWGDFRVITIRVNTLYTESNIYWLLYSGHLSIKGRFICSNFGAFICYNFPSLHFVSQYKVDWWLRPCIMSNSSITGYTHTQKSRPTKLSDY